MLKPTLMIHHVSDEIFQHPLEKFILTFDDGHDNHYATFSKFLEIPTQKIYFITCDWVGCPGFLTVDQIKYMSSFDNVMIGAHSFDHFDLNTNKLTLEEKIELMNTDTAKTIGWFQETLGFIPTIFCYPYNNAMYGIYTKILKKHGFTEFYGGERINVDRLSTWPHRIW